MKRYLFHIGLLLSLFLVACSSRERNALKMADAIIEQDTEKALCILDSLDQRKLNHGDLPYYALLMTQALVKNNVAVDSDTLISIAYNKYNNDWWGNKGIRSNFYMGEIFFNQELPHDAMKYYLTAYEESKRLENHYWRAKTAERIADLFFLNFNYDEAKKYRKEAIEYFALADMTTNQRYAEADLASILLNDGEPQKALQLYDSVLNECHKDTIKDSDLNNYIEESRLAALVVLGIAEESTFDAFEDTNIYKIDRDKLEYLLLKNDVKKSDTLNNKRDSVLINAEKFLSTEEDTLQLLYAKYLNSDETKDPALKLQLADSLLHFQERMTKEVLKESVIASHSDFYFSVADHQRKQSKLYLIITLMSSAIFLLLIILIWRSFCYKSQIHRKEIQSNLDSILSLQASTTILKAEKEQLNLRVENSIASITDLNHIIDEKEYALGKLQDELKEHLHTVNELEQELFLLRQTNKGKGVENLFKEQWSTLNMLCDEYFEMGDSEIGKNRILKSIEKELKRISSKKSLKQIEEEVNKYVDNIMNRIRTECGFLNEKDFTFLMLIYAGFSVRAICLFTDMKYGSFYVKKSRLIKKISASDAIDRDEFIDKLS